MPEFSSWRDGWYQMKFPTLLYVAEFDGISRPDHSHNQGWRSPTIEVISHSPRQELAGRKMFADTQPLESVFAILHARGFYQPPDERHVRDL